MYKAILFCTALIGTWFFFKGRKKELIVSKKDLTIEQGPLSKDLLGYIILNYINDYQTLHDISCVCKYFNEVCHGNRDIVKKRNKLSREQRYEKLNELHAIMKIYKYDINMMLERMEEFIEKNRRV